MISSEDVRRVTFEKAFHGYRCDDVDDYLKQVAQSMDELAAQNDDLQKKLVVLAQRIDQYRAEEDTLRTTMQSEWSYNVGVKGFKWDVTNGGSAPVNSALFLGTNWDKTVTSNKALAGVVVEAR